MAFQTDKGLMVDGICGPITQAALESVGSNDTGDTTIELEAPAMKKVVIASSGAEASVRAGNGDDYEVIVAAPIGASFDWVATAENGWHAVVLENQVGWVSREYSQIA